MNLAGKRVGVWGLGVVGKSVIAHLLQAHDIQVSVMDAKNPSSHDANYLADNAIPFYSQEAAQEFLHTNDYIIPSPGIDLRPYQQYRHKFIAELDLFAQEFKQPIIAVTGSIGKTSITTLLSQIIKHNGCNLATGGNIGLGMFDLLRDHYDKALLEVSSFQLDLCSTFSPELAIWTNLLPNHLDRHGTLEQYFWAKYAILAKQKPNQKALVPLQLKSQILAKNPEATLYFFTKDAPGHDELGTIDRLFFIDNETVVFHEHGITKPLIKLSALPHLSFAQNWLIICAALHILDVPLETIATTPFCLDELEHRLEKVATYRGIDFYNDSKSTTPQATLAAVENFNHKPVHLFLGGTSKGIDRSPLITDLQGKVRFVYCFGKEAESLKQLCDAAHIDADRYATLDAAFDACMKKVEPGSIVLLSPSGASFDLFENYKKRGAHFKKLVNHLLHAQKT